MYAQKALLKKQNIFLSDIPRKKQKIKLKSVSNMAQGGIATDVTDEIHPDFQNMVIRLCDFLKTGYFVPFR